MAMLDKYLKINLLAIMILLRDQCVNVVKTLSKLFSYLWKSHQMERNVFILKWSTIYPEGFLIYIY